MTDHEYRRVALVVDDWWLHSGEAALANLKSRLVRLTRDVARDAKKGGRPGRAPRRQPPTTRRKPA
jgi:hypothetical protein